MRVNKTKIEVIAPTLRRSGWRYMAVLPLMLMCGASTVVAQSALEACARIQDSAQRLSCYDEAMKQNGSAPVIQAPQSSGRGQDRAATTPAQPSVSRSRETVRSATAATPEVAAQGSARAEDFGLELKQADTPDNNTRTFTVASAARNTFTGWTISFTNGQVWKQVGTDPYTIKEGESYTITRASFNSFFLSNSSDNRRMRITRQQ